MSRQYSAEEVDTITSKVGRLIDGTYRWTSTIANPLCNRRAKYGTDAIREWREGRSITIRRVSLGSMPAGDGKIALGEIVAEMPNGATVCRITTGNGMVTMDRDMSTGSARKAMAFWDAFIHNTSPDGPTAGSIVTEGFDARAILARMVSAGTISMSDLSKFKAEIDAHREEDEDGFIQWCAERGLA